MKRILVVGLSITLFGCEKSGHDRDVTKSRVSESVSLRTAEEFKIIQTNLVGLIWHDEDGNTKRIDDRTRKGIFDILGSCSCPVVSRLDKRGWYGMIYSENGRDEFCMDLFEGGIIAISNGGEYDVGSTQVSRLVELASRGGKE